MTITTFEEAETFALEERGSIPPLPPIVQTTQAVEDDSHKIWLAGYNAAKENLLGEALAYPDYGFGDSDWHTFMAEIFAGGDELDRVEYEIFLEGQKAWRKMFFGSIFYLADKEK